MNALRSALEAVVWKGKSEILNLVDNRWTRYNIDLLVIMNLMEYYSGILAMEEWSLESKR